MREFFDFFHNKNTCMAYFWGKIRPLFAHYISVLRLYEIYFTVLLYLL